MTEGTKIYFTKDQLLNALPTSGSVLMGPRDAEDLKAVFKNKMEYTSRGPDAETCTAEQIRDLLEQEGFESMGPALKQVLIGVFPLSRLATIDIEDMPGYISQKIVKVVRGVVGDGDTDGRTVNMGQLEHLLGQERLDAGIIEIVRSGLQHDVEIALRVLDMPSSPME
ncbi:hypothetical protein HOE67_00730 [Candidatus Peregrinibacteria bacterium]|jgi:hypothetical protein|nr:hypothetical protein [Candidatus Peregrinibacteria bacterium]MBT4055614.1 hypothetical protein [Candidatus Peregrinibacteria bacterium]